MTFIEQALVDELRERAREVLAEKVDRPGASQMIRMGSHDMIDSSDALAAMHAFYVEAMEDAAKVADRRAAMASQVSLSAAMALLIALPDAIRDLTKDQPHAG